METKMETKHCTIEDFADGIKNAILEYFKLTGITVSEFLENLNNTEEIDLPSLSDIPKDFKIAPTGKIDIKSIPYMQAFEIPPIPYKKTQNIG